MGAGADRGPNRLATVPRESSVKLDSGDSVIVRILLISTYDLGRQPFGLASPAAWLEEAGFHVTCNDLAVESLDEDAVARARLVAFHLPMHTATRIALDVVGRVRRINPGARLAFYGLYAPANDVLLREMGADWILGGEVERELVEVARRIADGRLEGTTRISLERLSFKVPSRKGLPPLGRYAHVHVGETETRTVGYTEASRGCKHRCRHCPVVPVYDGKFRVVPRDVVLEDVGRQVAAGAEHITFGDPDFFNGVGHAVPLVRAMRRAHPRLTYDVTIKVEHLLRHADCLPVLRETGCLFVTTAVESFDDDVLGRLDKGHTRAGFLDALGRCRQAGLVLNPTFVAFHPWMNADGYREFLDTLESLDLVRQVASVQLALRLLVPGGSRLLDRPEVRERVGPFDPRALVHPWSHPDPSVDELHTGVQSRVERGTSQGRDRETIFASVRALAFGDEDPRGPRPDPAGARRPFVPYLTEPWYC